MTLGGKEAPRPPLSQRFETLGRRADGRDACLLLSGNEISIPRGRRLALAIVLLFYRLGDWPMLFALGLIGGLIGI